MVGVAANQIKVKSIKLTMRLEGATSAIAEQLFDAPLITIGRAPSSSLIIESAEIADEQWIIINENEEPFLVNRAEGTLWRDEALPLAAQRPLSNGDLVRTGDFVVEVSIFNKDEAPELVSTNGGANGAADHELAEAATLPQPAEGTEEATAEALTRRPTNRFAAILDSLRTDEDRYYFLLESGAQSGARLLVEDQELVVGWDQTGGNITADPWAVALPRLRVSKNWSGVFVSAPHPEEVEINGEPLAEPRRLRHGDHVVIAPALSPTDDGVVLVFHEPTSLVVLDNLLPESLPPPLTPDAEKDSPTEPVAFTSFTSVSAEITVAPDKKRKLKKKKKLPRLYFGAFTAGDLALMTAGTLLGAAIVFLFLVYG